MVLHQFWQGAFHKWSARKCCLLAWDSWDNEFSQRFLNQSARLKTVSFFLEFYIQIFDKGWIMLNVKFRLPLLSFQPLYVSITVSDPAGSTDFRNYPSLSLGGSSESQNCRYLLLYCCGEQISRLRSQLIFWIHIHIYQLHFNI